MTRGVKLAATFAICVAGFGVLLGTAAVGSNGNKIEQRVLSDTANGKQATFVIYLKEQADLSAAYRMKDQNARGWYVYRALTKEAARTQAPIRALLSSEGVSFKPFWVANVIFVNGDRSVVDQLAARSDVREIEASDRENWLQDVDAGAPRASSSSPRTVEPGPAQVHAPQVWALGSWSATRTRACAGRTKR